MPISIQAWGRPAIPADPNVDLATYVYRDATNTGLAGIGLAEADLTQYDGPTLVVQDSGPFVVEDKIINQEIRFNTGGAVTLRRCKLNGRLDASVPGATVVLEDCTIDAGTTNLLAVNAFGLTMRRCDVSGGAASIAFGPDSLVEDCYTHGQYVAPDLDTHTGAISTFGAQHAIVRRCTINNDSVDNAVGGGPTGDFQIFGDTAVNTDILVEYCYLAATDGGYSCALGYDPGKNFGANPTYIVFRHNIFGRGSNGKGGSFGTTTDWLPDAGDGVTGVGNRYYDNIWQDTGEPVPANL
jgi:hypothetical protein